MNRTSAETTCQMLNRLYPMPNGSYSWQAQNILFDLSAPRMRHRRLQHENLANWQALLSQWQRRCADEARAYGESDRYTVNTVQILETIVTALVTAKLEG